MSQKKLFKKYQKNNDNKKQGGINFGRTEPISPGTNTSSIGLEQHERHELLQERRPEIEGNSSSTIRENRKGIRRFLKRRRS